MLWDVASFDPLGFHFFSLFVPHGTPLPMIPFIFIVELLSFLVRPFSLGGVPVLNLRSTKFNRRRAPLMPCVVPSPARPPGVVDSPVCITAWRKVPVVRMTAGAR